MEAKLCITMQVSNRFLYHIQNAINELYQARMILLLPSDLDRDSVIFIFIFKKSNSKFSVSFIFSSDYYIGNWWLPADLLNQEIKSYSVARQSSCLEAEVINKDKDNQPGSRKAASLITTSSMKPFNKFLLCTLRTILRLKCCYKLFIQQFWTVNKFMKIMISLQFMNKKKGGEGSILRINLSV